MNYLGIEASVRNLPELDRDFFPLYKFNHAFLASAKKPLGVTVSACGGCSVDGAVRPATWINLDT